MERNNLEYVGFWQRVAASLIDTVLLGFICYPALTVVYGQAYWTRTSIMVGPADFLINWVFPAISVILFWIYQQATPGKMAIGARIVDARTGNEIITGQCIGRYFGYFVSMIPLFLGIFWVGLDARKQGWHDKLAGTVVVRSRRRGNVEFES